MYAVQKLSMNGNSATVTIPRKLLAAVGLSLGQYVVIELLEDRTVRIRPWRDTEIAKPAAPIVDAAPAEHSPA